MPAPDDTTPAIPPISVVGAKLFSGPGDPNDFAAASPGSLFLRTDGRGACLYLKADNGSWRLLVQEDRDWSSAKSPKAPEAWPFVRSESKFSAT
jgi:hypothetical protein